MHSRIDETVARIVDPAPARNVYVNRNMIGAVVGTQPSAARSNPGTGPKAGGPHHLQRSTAEQVVTVNTAAAGGNAGLLAPKDALERPKTMACECLKIGLVAQENNTMRDMIALFLVST